MKLDLLLVVATSVAASSFSTVTTFIAPPCSQISLRVKAVRLRAEPDAAPPTALQQPCPEFPRCTGEYREKGCDGKGRIAGGVGALLPWLPIKAYRPCPAFVEAKYKYSRQGQSLDEVVFARREEVPIPDMTLDSVDNNQETNDASVDGAGTENAPEKELKE